MKTLILLALILPPQDQDSAPVAAAKKTAEAGSYTYKITSRNKKVTRAFQGLYVEKEKAYLVEGDKEVNETGGEAEVGAPSIDAGGEVLRQIGEVGLRGGPSVVLYADVDVR